jgi:hypothetical protein
MLAFIFARFNGGVQRWGGFEPNAVYNIETVSKHLYGGSAEVEVITQPNEDSPESKTQSAEHSPEE